MGSMKQVYKIIFSLEIYACRSMTFFFIRPNRIQEHSIDIF